MKQALKIILASALATAALIKGVPALAEPAAPTNVSIVRTADLDLTSEKGRDVLEQRIAVAAHAVCDSASATDLKALNAQRDCRQSVLASARQKAQAIAAGKDDGAVVVATR